MKVENRSSLCFCNIHLIEFIEGVCPFCLNERLLVLASLQRLRPPSPPPSYHTIQEPTNILGNVSKKQKIRMFSFFSFFKLRRHRKSDHQTTSISSPEDSFISIKFEDNKATSWEKGNERIQIEDCKASRDNNFEAVIIHTKKKETYHHLIPRTWRKRISRLVRVISFRSHISAKVKSDDFSRTWSRPPPSATYNKTRI